MIKGRQEKNRLIKQSIVKFRMIEEEDFTF